MTEGENAKVETITDRIHAAGVESARSNLSWWSRRLITVSRLEGDDRDEMLIAQAQRQVTEMETWLDEHG